MTYRWPAKGMRAVLDSRTGLAISWLDVKLGVRMLGKEPLLTAVAILTLAVGIPTSLSPAHIMSLFDSTFPVDEGDRIVGIRNWDTEDNRPTVRALHDFDVWRKELSSFDQVAAARSDPWNVHSPDGKAEEIRGAEVSASAFVMLRVPPLLGRPLIEADESIDAPRVVVIGEGIWASRFGRDPDIVGKQIGIGRTPHTVVGVMPEGFLFPMRDHLWLPLRANPVDYEVGAGPDIFVFGRLADGVTEREANAELEIIGRRLAAEWPDTHARLRPEVVRIALLALGQPASGMSESREVLLVQVFALLLLFVACGNVGTMTLARTAARLNEIAVRTALGASRARIVSQLFVESLVLAVLATGIGLILADRVIRWFTALVVDEVPYWFDMGLDLESISLALGLAAVCAVGAGVFPALKVTGYGVQGSLQATAGGATVRFGIFTTLLVVTEIALSVGFLSMGTVAARSALTDTSGDVEIDIDRYLTARYRTVWIDPTADQAETHLETFLTQVGANQEELKLRLQADPSVRAVAMGLNLPGMGHRFRPIEFDGAVSGADGGGVRVAQAAVHVDFFQDFGHPILEGRGFGSGDLPAERNAHRAATVVNTSFVEQMLGGGGALGRRFRYAVGRDQEPGEWYEIVGVVGDLAMNVGNPDRAAGVYHPQGASEIHPMRYIIDVGENPNAFLPRLRAIASEVDPDAIIQVPRTLKEIAALNRLEIQMAALLVVSLSGIGALLAAAGLYALMAFTVAQRTREIGIRIALGAGARRVMETIARRAAVQLAWGIVVGAAFGAWILSEISGDREIIDFNPPVVLAVVSGAVVLIVCIACLAPILRGLKVDPTDALREG